MPEIVKCTLNKVAMKRMTGWYQLCVGMMGGLRRILEEKIRRIVWDIKKSRCKGDRYCKVGRRGK